MPLSVSKLLIASFDKPEDVMLREMFPIRTYANFFSSIQFLFSFILLGVLLFII